MYLIIVGAGPVGMSLGEIAIQDGHSVVFIEADEERAKQASEKFDALVLHADIAQGDILKEAGAEKADVLAAVTSDDSANLMAMFLGSEQGIKNLISVVNEAGHKGLFERLGVHVVVDPEVIVARHLYGLINHPRLAECVSLPSGEQIFEVSVNGNSPLVGKTLAEVGQDELLPKQFLIVSIKRDNKAIVPNGSSKLQADDHLTIFSPEAPSEKQLKAFSG